MPAVPSGPAPTPKPIEDSTEKLFKEIAGDDMEIDWMELKRILDHTMRDGSISSIISTLIASENESLLFRICTANDWSERC